MEMAANSWNDWKWLENSGIARWLEMARNGLTFVEWLDISGNDWNGWKWLGVAKHG